MPRLIFYQQGTEREVWVGVPVNVDNGNRTDKQAQGKLLQSDLDKLVKEEAKTNSKMNRFIKSTSGDACQSSRTETSFSTVSLSSPSRKAGKDRIGKTLRKMRKTL